MPAKASEYAAPPSGTKAESERSDGDFFDRLDPPSSPDSDADSGSGSFGATSSPHSETLTIFDYDDTFLPSTYLASLGLRVDDTGPLPRDLADELTTLEAQVIKILKTSLRHGVVKIVTNAEEGWIELSGGRFMPKLTSFLRDTPDIKLVSARTQFEVDYPDNPSSWKIAAFAAEVDDCYPGKRNLNVLVLGDSLSERDAAHALSSRIPSSCVKSIKLVERPTVSQLLRQITLLQGTFGDLVNHYTSFDVNLAC
jgi:hypothetical protein